MWHKRRRDSALNLLAYEQLAAQGNHLSIQADTRRSVRNEQKIAATPFNKLNEPSIQLY
jgi:hypothetical protein